MSAYSADLELARLCAEGDEPAWERFVREYRPLLYRAADALDRTQGAREIADSLYADLYGIGKSGGERQSLFRYRPNDPVTNAYRALAQEVLNGST